MSSNLLQRRALLIHALFWCVYFSFFLFQLSLSPKSADREPLELLLDAGFHVMAMMATAYVNYFVFFPRFLVHRNVGRYILEFAGPFALLMAGTIHVKRFIADGYTHKFAFMYTERFTILIVVNTLFIVLFVAMLKFVEDWLELEDRRKEIENEKLTSELRFLKAQINPHFLFNTLNNLYYLAFMQSPNTPEVIAKLSQMMRYMIYDSNHATVPLQKEIEYMENYIALERLRLNNQIPIEFEVNGPVERVQVTPLVLITFLENAFKHGVSNNATDAWVKVSLSVEGKRLLYRVENSILSIKDEKTKEPSGIGLQNAQRRLDLSYPNRHRLNIVQQPDRYTVELTLVRGE
jgi:two-component system, LytTR family, sensor histidine kinase AlgZ